MHSDIRAAEDRASIIAFLNREDSRLLAESYKDGLPKWEVSMLRVKAGQCRTLAGQVVRGEDLCP